MFTGIITDIGTIRSHEQRGDLRLVIGCGYAMDSVAIGASIACSGACLTVVDKGDDWFAVDLSAETVSRTAPGLWQQGGRLNLERALKVGDELGGHIVTGHVDAVGHLVSAQSEGDSIRLVIRAPQALAAALAAKGSITLDGISLTVNSVEDQPDGSVDFGLNIIPHTTAATTLDRLEDGRAFNLEIDVLARYLDRMQALRSGVM
ncbi:MULTISPECIES: riboflavin synthase [Sphingobium]|jgi:riboflavin synthase|uniref:Riboflavin synthase n=1 Tax=Sphingobium soli TaxID=1591116 RepID=A0ABS8H9K1_9SPHN|nr:MULTISPECIES: riboflavin synthase [Sphingobium]MAP45251.1 riboflavin synthase [Sphingobium sp.]MBA38854.1 riboflavin synthase [Sphingobium sp.]MBS49408.1 riboflavin synthase [Sphingobium sp.]MCC4234236.1 riboflavin synthase [Sphingobium soli]MCC4258243.1 riboflavin synthase [Sphingobium lactosutens]|tara:strand:- start:385 stop:999 length:615 start_codon:yes stop_codon:yes gene_type:complete